MEQCWLPAILDIKKYIISICCLMLLLFIKQNQLKKALELKLEDTDLTKFYFSLGMCLFLENLLNSARLLLIICNAEKESFRLSINHCKNK